MWIVPNGNGGWQSSMRTGIKIFRSAAIEASARTKSEEIADSDQKDNCRSCIAYYRFNFVGEFVPGSRSTSHQTLCPRFARASAIACAFSRSSRLYEMKTSDIISLRRLVPSRLYTNE